MAVVERYLECVVGHDWQGLADCVAADVVRVGPFGDEYRGREAYVAFLADLMPRLPGYSMDVARVRYGDGWAVAELTETVTLDDLPVVTPEALLFELDTDSRIARIDIYVQRRAEPEVRNPRRSP